MPEIIYRFANPWFLLALPIPLMLLLLHLRRNRRAVPAVTYSDLSIARGLPRSPRQTLLAMMPWVRTLALCLGVIALARPQYGTTEFSVSSLGVDIAMVMDVSGSMQDTDFFPNRLEAAKRAAITFVENRKTDRVSVILFATSAAVLCPPTLDMGAVKLFIDSIHDGIIQNNSTAVGDGLALGVKQLSEKEDEVDVAQSRVVVLLTDGESNSGKLSPLQAAEIAKSLGVRVYTIGMGGGTAGPGGTFRAPRSGGYNEESLRQIADMTGGLFFSANNEKKLEQIYREIDQLERSRIETNQTTDYNEQFMLFWFPALALLGLEFLLKALLLGRLP